MMKNIRTLARYLLASLSVPAALLILPAHDALATLGGDLSSIQADAASIQGTVGPVQEKNGYSIYVIRSTEHHIRALVEYLSSDGVVVAIAASAHGNINAKRFIENSYFEKARQARLATVTTKVKGRMAPGRVTHKDVVIETSGHPGNIVLRAFLPQKLPVTLTEDLISPRDDQ